MLFGKIVYLLIALQQYFNCAQCLGYITPNTSTKNLRRDRHNPRWRTVSDEPSSNPGVHSTYSRLTMINETDYPSVRSSRSKPIVFPTSQPIEPTEQPMERSKVLLPDLDENGLPKCVKNPGDTFCEQVDNYPKINLKTDFGVNLEEFRDIFGVKEIDARKSYFDDDIADERICGGPRKIVFPKMAKTQSKRWVYIVNDDDNFRQSVVTEICARPGKPCGYLEEDNLPSGLSSQCRQKYARARLMALHPTEQRTYPEYFEFPSCCACYIKNPYQGRSKYRQ